MEKGTDFFKESSIHRPDSGQPKTEMEISLEDFKRAEAAIWATIDLEPGNSLDSFPELLQEKVKTLPRYKELEQAMENIPSDLLFHEVFKKISRKSDPPIDASDAPDDGVLLSSMKHGPLECAGRVLIASTYLSERKIPHLVAKPPGHSMMVYEVDDDTLAYADPNNDLYFTFPKSALQGYKGGQKTAECTITEYTPREKDIVDGTGTVFNRFLVLSPKLGTLVSYLGNIQAALDGHGEFKKSGIVKDEKAAEAVDYIKKILIPKDVILENWEACLNNLKKEELEKDKLSREIFMNILNKNPDEDTFVKAMLIALDSVLGEKYLYLRHASKNTKVEWAKRIWQKIKSNPKQLEAMFENKG